MTGPPRLSNHASEENRGTTISLYGVTNHAFADNYRCWWLPNVAYTFVLLKYESAMTWTQVKLYFAWLATSTASNFKLYGHKPRQYAGDREPNWVFPDTSAVFSGGAGVSSSEWELLSVSWTGWTTSATTARKKSPYSSVSSSTLFDGLAIVRTTTATDDVLCTAEVTGAGSRYEVARASSHFS
jgi:hypothetical protein